MSSAWQIIGATVQGTSHQKGKMPRQDTFGYSVVDLGKNVRKPGVVIVIADGAGSAKHSERGAEIAMKSSLLYLKKTLVEKGTPRNDTTWEHLFAWVFGRARQRIVDMSQEENIPLRELHTTLACAVVSKDWLAVAQVGNMVVVAQAGDDTLFAAIPSRRGEYAEETFFLTMEQGLQYMDTRVHVQKIRALVMMSDGLERLALAPDKTPYAPFFQPILAFVKQADDVSAARSQLAAFLESDRVSERTDDDKTLVAASYCADENSAL